MARVCDAPVPVTSSPARRLLRRIAYAVAARRRRAAIVVAAIALSLLVAPPVRAAVGDWFGFAGVLVRHDPVPETSSASPPPTVGTSTSLDAAKNLLAFEPVVPTELGLPRGVEVSADRRVLSMSWAGGRDGTVRLDEFDGRLDFTFAKSAPGVEFASVAGSFALWFDEPHGVVVLNRDGTTRMETARLAGHTLIWEHGSTTVRLEGDLSLARAIEVAESVRIMP
ncbi:MAG: hypothetical protein QOE19_4107 [Actinomycetota bacterium]|nr:hypothetical protein [Actinomycetota bacterium]